MSRLANAEPSIALGLTLDEFSCARSRKKEGGELSPCRDRRRVVKSPSLKKLQKLFSRSIVAPRPVALDDFDERVCGLGAPVLRIKQDGQIEARLVVVWVGRDFLRKVQGVAKASCLLSEAECGFSGNDCLILLAAPADRGEHALCTFELPRSDKKSCQSGDGSRLARARGEHGPVNIRRALDIPGSRQSFGLG